MNLPEEVRNCKVSDYYCQMLSSFSEYEKKEFNKEKRAISEAIYYHLCTMKFAGWKHRVRFNRYKKHTIAEIFQDLIAYYLNVYLPDDYSVILEKKKKKTQPDILIKKGKNYHFAIELKTNIGWSRPEEDFSESIQSRIDSLAQNFSISSDKIIYIYEEHSNVTQKFSNLYWDKDKSRATERPEDFPFNVIYPLFNQTDPYYWYSDNKGIKKQNEFNENVTPELILERAKVNIVTPFEDILSLVLQ